MIVGEQKVLLPKRQNTVLFSVDSQRGHYSRTHTILYTQYRHIVAVFFSSDDDSLGRKGFFEATVSVLQGSSSTGRVIILVSLVFLFIVRFVYDFSFGFVSVHIACLFALYICLCRMSRTDSSSSLTRRSISRRRARSRSSSPRRSPSPGWRRTELAMSSAAEGRSFGSG